MRLGPAPCGRSEIEAGTEPPCAAIREECMTVSRRTFARVAAAGTVAIASPAIAQTPTLKWRLASSFPKSIEGLWGASPTVAKFVNAMSDGKFVIDTFAAGALV